MGSYVSVDLFWLKAALAAFLGLLWLFGWYLRRAACRPRRDEIPFERQYERIEPESGPLGSVQRIRDLLLTLHRYWDRAALLLLVVGVGVTFSDPVVQGIVGITMLIMAAILVVWFRHRQVPSGVTELRENE